MRNRERLAVRTSPEKLSAAASGEAELPQFRGGTVVVVDRLIRGIGVDLAGAVAVDLCPDAAEKPGQLRFVVGAHAFARGAPLGFGGHDPDGTVFQPGRPSARAHQRISRDGRDQQSSRRATFVPEGAQTGRRVFTSSDGDLQAAVGAPIAQVCVCRGPLTLIGWLAMVQRCSDRSQIMRTVPARSSALEAM